MWSQAKNDCRRFGPRFIGVCRFLLEREIPGNEPLVFANTWNGSTRMAARCKSSTFNRSSTLHCKHPPAKRRAANLISPQPTSSPVQPPPPYLPHLSGGSSGQQGVCASQSARPILCRANQMLNRMAAGVDSPAHPFRALSKMQHAE